PATTMGLDAVANEEGSPLCRSRTLQTVVRGSLAQAARLQRHVRRPSVLRRAAVAEARPDFRRAVLARERSPPPGDAATRFADAGSGLQPADAAQSSWSRAWSGEGHAFRYCLVQREASGTGPPHD